MRNLMAEIEAAVIIEKSIKAEKALEEWRKKQVTPMALLIKLTDKQNRTRNGMTWGPGVTHSAPGDGVRLCSGDVIHAYRSVELAAFLWRAHLEYYDPIAWIAEGEVITDDGTKVGCKSLTTIQRTELPQPTTEECVRFGILSAMAVYPDPEFSKWASDWLSGKDRSIEAAWAAEARSEKAVVARSAASAAAWAVEARSAKASSKIDFQSIAMEALKSDSIPTT